MTEGLQVKRDIHNKFEAVFSGTTLPAIVAPMFLVSGPDLVVNACKAGMVGAFPFPNCRTIDVLDDWLAQIDREVGKDANAAPYAVNLTTHSSYDRLADEVALIAKYQPKIVITALGGPEPVIETVHNYGGIVIADVNSIKYARKAVNKGVDGLALLSAGAGGHTGSIAGFSFVSAVREFFDGIIILAGGISDGAGIRAAEILGADLSYMGTRFIATNESIASEEYKDMVVAATHEDLVLSDALTGAKAYYLKASLEKMGMDPNNPGKGTGMDLSSSQSQIKAWRDVWSAGHGVGLVGKREPVAEIISKLKHEYDVACQIGRS